MQVTLRTSLIEEGNRPISIDHVTDKKNLLLLVQLRWLAVIGQVVTILVVHFWFGIALPLIQLAIVIAFLIGLNIVSLLRHLYRNIVSNTELFLALLLDVAASSRPNFAGRAYGQSLCLALSFAGHACGGACLMRGRGLDLVIITGGCFIWLTAFRGSLLVGVDMAAFRLADIRASFVCLRVLPPTLLATFRNPASIGDLRARDARVASLRQRSGRRRPHRQDRPARLGSRPRTRDPACDALGDLEHLATHANS